MNQSIYNAAKEMFLNGQSLRQIGQTLNIDRKKLSLMLRKDNVYTNKKIESKVLNEAIKLINAGQKITNVAVKLKVDRHTLSKELKNKGIKEPQKRHTRNKKYDSSIIKMYTEEKLSIESISKEINVSTNLVWNCLLDYGINDSDRLFRNYEYNTDRFSSIRTEEEAYWLGFLYADGYVNQYGTVIELCLQKQDDYHVIKFRDFVSNKKTYDKDVYGHMQHRVNISNKQIAQNLINCGCMNNKTFILKFSRNIVPENLMNHFIRGFFDADGCICISQKRLVFSIVSASHEFIEDFQSYLVENLHINKTKMQTTNENIYSFANSAKADIKKLFDYLYKDATIYLDRKYDKFKNINK